MECMLKRLLPFVLTLLLGFALWIFLSPRIRVARDVQYLESEAVTANLQPSIKCAYSKMDLKHLSEDESALFSRAMMGDLGSAYNDYIEIAITESSLDIEQRDGGEIQFFKQGTDNLNILSIPQPNYWHQGANHKFCLGAMVYVTFSASGKVTDVEPLPLFKNCSDECLEDVVDAASQIRFIPATKNGQAVSEHATIMYRYHFD
jgi:hypothetical protein